MVEIEADIPDTDKSRIWDEDIAQNESKKENFS